MLVQPQTKGLVSCFGNQTPHVYHKWFWVAVFALQTWEVKHTAVIQISLLRFLKDVSHSPAVLTSVHCQITFLCSLGQNPDPETSGFLKVHYGFWTPRIVRSRHSLGQACALRILNPSLYIGSILESHEHRVAILPKRIKQLEQLGLRQSQIIKPEQRSAVASNSFA